MATIVIKKKQNMVLRPLGIFIRRFHLLIFFVIVAGCLGYAVTMLNDTSSTEDETSYTSPITSGAIDQTTLDRIQALHTSSQPSQAPELPAGRINPFAE